MPRDVHPFAPASLRELEATLRTRVAGEVDFSAGARALYATDASNYRQPPIGVVLPKTTEDVEATVRTCHEFGAAILPRGGGTSLAGQCCNAAVVCGAFASPLSEPRPSSPGKAPRGRDGRTRPYHPSAVEIILTEAPRHLRRRFDPQSSLSLIDPERS
jgi:hypothetical protein